MATSFPLEVYTFAYYEIGNCNKIILHSSYWNPLAGQLLKGLVFQAAPVYIFNNKILKLMKMT